MQIVDLDKFSRLEFKYIFDHLIVHQLYFNTTKDA